MIHIENADERAYAEYLSKDLKCAYEHPFVLKLISSLRDSVKRYDRSLVPNGYYEAIACWVSVEFDADGKVASVTPVSGEEGAQLCLVYPNTFDDVPPYAGTWDGVVEDFHNDDPTEWAMVREYKVFGYEHNGCTDPSGYRFLKTTLRVVAPNGEGSECLPDYFHFAAKEVTAVNAFLAQWDTEEYGNFDGFIFEDVPVRLVIAKEPGAKPFTGNWDSAPWQEA